MTKSEFEKLAGYEVSNNDYCKIIEPMYMSVDLSKEEFVKVIDKKRFAIKTKQQIAAKMKSLATLEHCARFDSGWLFSLFGAYYIKIKGVLL